MLQCYNVTFCCLLCRLGVVDAVLVTYPFHCFWREHLTPVPYTQTGEMVLFVVEPTSEGVHAHSGSCSELVFVHRFHDANVLKIFELCKKFLDIFRAISINKHQKTPETGKEHQRLRQLSYLCIVNPERQADGARFTPQRRRISRSAEQQKTDPDPLPRG